MMECLSLYIWFSTENDDENPIGQLIHLNVYESGSYRRAPYGVTIEVTSDGHSDSVTIKNGRVRDGNGPAFNATLFRGREVFLNWKVKITVTFNAWSSRVSDPKTMLDDLLKFVLAGKQVTLVGNNGKVTVSKRLLQARSPALQAMLTHDTKEKRESQIELEEFDAKTLEAFVCFLATDEVIFDKETILGLYILGDKYDLQSLKLKARKLTLARTKELDPKKVFDVVSKIDTDMIEKCFLKEYAS